MQTLQAVIMGVFQGLTEFLPVSSSGHIVLSSAFYKMLTGADPSIVQNEEIFFDILVHLSTLVAVFIYFWNDIKQTTLGFVSSVKTKEYENDNFKSGLYIIIATIITGVLGLIMEEAAHNLTENPFIVSIFIITTGAILLLSENINTFKSKMDLKTALMVGLFQGIASMPGLSRSGLTISAAMFMGVKRFEAAKFSFLLSIPIILLASLIYPLITFDLADIKNFNFAALFSGMVTAFVVGYFCIKYFMRFLKNNSLKGFAYYCFIIGTISAVIFYINE